MFNVSKKFWFFKIFEIYKFWWDYLLPAVKSTIKFKKVMMAQSFKKILMLSNLLNSKRINYPFNSRFFQSIYNSASLKEKSLEFTEKISRHKNCRSFLVSWITCLRFGKINFAKLGKNFAKCFNLGKHIKFSDFILKNFMNIIKVVLLTFFSLFYYFF